MKKAMIALMLIGSLAGCGVNASETHQTDAEFFERHEGMPTVGPPLPESAELDCE